MFVFGKTFDMYSFSILYLFDVIFAGSSGGLTGCSLIISTCTFVSFNNKSSFPSDVIISFIPNCVFAGYTSLFTVNAICTILSSLLLPAFFIATNSFVSLLYLSCSQLFFVVKLRCSTFSKISSSYSNVA